MNDATSWQLILARHAKSSWHFPALKDDERPLNARGWRDAPRMAAWLANREPIPDLIMTSYATRALTTARVLAHAWAYPVDAIRISEQLYEADLPALLGVLRSFDETLQRIVMVGHNPGFNVLLTELTGLAIDNIPTCGIASIQLPVPWAQVTTECGELDWLQIPKHLVGLSDLTAEEDSV